MIPCNVLWLDAADTNTLTLSGTNVLTWKDKSGRGYDASAVGTTPYVANKLNGYGGVLLTPAGGWMIGSSPLEGSNFSGFVVTDMSSNVGSSGRLFSLGTVGTGDGTSLLRTALLMRNSNAQGIRTLRNAVQLSSIAVSLNQPFIASSVFTGTSNIIYRSGNGATAQASSGLFQFSNYGLGKDPGTTSFRYSGHIYEVLLYQDALSTQTRQAVEGYLASKWGIQSGLPNTHPNTKIPPFLRPFAPVDISGCTLLLDSADSTSLTLTGSTVSSWMDKSGSGRNATPYSIYGGPTFSNNDPRGIPAVTFNGTNQALTTATALPVPRAMFVVGSQSTASRNFLTGIGTDGTGHGPYYASFKSDMNYGVMNTANSVFLANNPSTALNTDYILTGLFNGSNSVTALINGGTLSNSVVFSGTPKTPATTIIGANWYIGTIFNLWPGKINEYIAFSNVLSTQERQQIEGYIAWKWKLLDSLPSTHGYKLYPPMTLTFSPLVLSNCQFWYDAADTSTLTLSNDNVTAWGDKSGNSRNLARGSTPGPFYTSNFNGSYPTVQAISEFNGHMRVLNIASSNIQGVTGSTFFLVMNHDGGRVITQYAEPRFLSLEVSNVSQRYDYGPEGSNVARTLPAPYTYSNAQIFTVLLNRTTSNYIIYQTGLELSNTSGVIPITLSYTRNLNFFALDGSVLPGYLKLSEFVGYNRSLTSNERQQVEGYLAWKWGLVESLPSNHPYKTIKP